MNLRRPVFIASLIMIFALVPVFPTFVLADQLFNNPGESFVFGSDSPVATSNPSTQQGPVISGNIAVWQDTRIENNYRDRIFYRDLSQPGSQEQALTPNISFQGSPSIDGTRVAWSQRVNPPTGGTGAQIFFMNIGGPGPNLLSSASYSQTYPDISGDRIVWTDGRQGSWNSDIYMVDLISGQEIPIATETGNQMQPAIDGDWVIWINNDQYNLGSPRINDLYAKNLATGEVRPITADSGSVQQELPDISGSKIVWDVNGSFNHCLFLHDLDTGQTIPIPNSDNAERPAIENNIVVWDRYYPTREIFMYNTETGITQQVTSGIGPYVARAAYSSGHIIWEDDRDGSRAIYQNKIGDNAQALANRFAPQLNMHREEHFQPRKVDIMTTGTGDAWPVLKGARYLNGWIYDTIFATSPESPSIPMETLFNYRSVSNDGAASSTPKFIDLPGDVTLAWSTSTFSEHFLRTNYVDAYNDLVGTDAFPERAYAHVVKGTDRTIIQYWLPYYFDNFDNYHEGDWEHVDVILNGDLQPTSAAYSGHDGGRKRVWDFVEGPDSHPIVYVAKGSHANYFAADEYRLNPMSTDHTEAGTAISPAVEVLPPIESSRMNELTESPYKWLAFQGLWGEYVNAPGGDGPQGPAADPEHNSIWDDPFSWFDNDENVPWDGASMPLMSGEGYSMGTLACPADLHLYDSQGRHVGKNASGSIDKEIPGAEYIEIPSQERKTIFVHGGDVSTGLRYEVKGTGTGTFDLSLVSPDRQQNTSDAVIFQSVPVDATSEAEVTVDQIKDYTLSVDVNGDGTVDSQVQPNSITTSSIDLTPPSDTTDLAVTDATSGVANLAFSAPGDDGSSGTAQYYDIRYSESLITEDNWKEAIPLEQNPVAQQAGSQVTATVTGLEAGTLYYFALKSEDEAGLSSGISNMAQATTDMPRLTWSRLRVYWASWADYQNRLLSIDYRLSNVGTGTALGTTVTASICNPTSVYVTTPLPLVAGDLNSSASSVVLLKYYVPVNVTNFSTTTYVHTLDDAGRTYWFPRPMP